MKVFGISVLLVMVFYKFQQDINLPSPFDDSGLVSELSLPINLSATGNDDAEENLGFDDAIFSNLLLEPPLSQEECTVDELASSKKRYQGWEKYQVREIWLDFTAEPGGRRRLANTREKLNAALVAIQQHMQQSSPVSFSVKEGIVVTTYPALFARTKSTLEYLRKVLGCTLPIEVWIEPNVTYTRINASSISRADIDSLSAIPNVQVNTFSKEIVQKMIVFSSLYDKNADLPPPDAVVPNFLKYLAVVCSKFQDVIFIDGDNFVLRDVKMFLKDPTYISTGLLLWPYFWKPSIFNSIWPVLDIKCTNDFELDMGQFVIDKARHWKSLQLAIYFLLDPDFADSIFFMDADALSRAVKLYRMPYSVISHAALPAGSVNPSGSFKGIATLQYWWDGLPIFMHMNFLSSSRVSALSSEVFVSSLGIDDGLVFDEDGTLSTDSASALLVNLKMDYSAIFTANFTSSYRKMDSRISIVDRVTSSSMIGTRVKPVQNVDIKNATTVTTAQIPKKHWLGKTGKIRKSTQNKLKKRLRDDAARK